MNQRDEHIERSVRYIRERVKALPKVGLVLGSGLGGFADTLPRPIVLPTAGIPHYPVSTVEGHRGRLVFSTLDNGLNVLAFQGRIHFYESHDLSTVLFPISIAHALGVRILLVTNAAGGINRSFQPGDLMVITDQVNLTLEPPSRFKHGLPLERQSVYDPELIDRTLDIAMALGIPVRKGVYAGVKGPSYETASEVEMVHRLGGDVVGMSTVPEVDLAASLGIRVLGITCITNKATGIGAARLSHQEVTEVADRVRQDFARLLEGILRSLS